VIGYLILCSVAPHLQFAARGHHSHLCIVKQNSPMLVCRQFSLTQEGLDRVIPGIKGPGDRINVGRRDVYFCHMCIPLLTYDLPRN